MRLIDGSFLEERCERQMSDKWNKEACPRSWADAYEQFLTDVENCATIDAVPVVRCGECRWHEDEQPGMVYCPATVGGWVEDDWFCKGGERKDGDGDG